MLRCGNDIGHHSSTGHWTEDSCIPLADNTPCYRDWLVENSLALVSKVLLCRAEPEAPLSTPTFPLSVVHVAHHGVHEVCPAAKHPLCHSTDIYHRSGRTPTPSTPPRSTSIPLTTIATVDMSPAANEETVLSTPGGEIRVRPFRSSSNAQMKAILSFTPRVASLNKENVRSQSDEFRGFFTLFWIGELLPRLPVRGRV